MHPLKLYEKLAQQFSDGDLDALPVILDTIQEGVTGLKGALVPIRRTLITRYPRSETVIPGPPMGHALIAKNKEITIFGEYKGHPIFRVYKVPNIVLPVLIPEAQEAKKLYDEAVKPDLGFYAQTEPYLTYVNVDRITFSYKTREETIPKKNRYQSPFTLPGFWNDFVISPNNLGRYKIPDKSDRERRASQERRYQ